MSADSRFRKGQIVRHKLTPEDRYLILKNATRDGEDTVVVRGEDGDEHTFYTFELEPITEKSKVTKLREGKKSA
jgi:hypothetical protein